MADNIRLMITAATAIKYPASLDTLPSAMTFLTERANMSYGASSASLNANIATKANVLASPIIIRDAKLCKLPTVSNPTTAQRKHMGM
jgi:hypothetical protein